MPIKIQDKLPATRTLNSENIFVITEKRALKQDIRPLKILILNLMPTKIATETQLLRLLGNTPLQVEIELMNTKSHISKNISQEHLISFYKTFDDYKDRKFDGMIITGAPVENLEFEDVDYWNELTKIMEWSKSHVTSTLHICWGAQAGMYYHFGIKKYPLEKKMFGIFPHHISKSNCPLLRGFDDVFYVPHSRYTQTRKEDIKNVEGLSILAESDESGVYIAATKKGRQIFVTGHSEYDYDTLKNEYMRDIERGLNIDIPKNYFKNDNPKEKPLNTWKSHANLMFSNWLNYYVYQATPYDIEKVNRK